MKTLLRFVRADLLQFRYSSTTLIAAASAVGLAALLTGMLVSTAGAETGIDLGTAWGQGEVLVDPLTGLILLGLFASVWGNSYRDRSVTWSYLQTPHRGTVLAAQLISSAIVAFVVGLLAVAAKVATLQVMAGPPPAPWWTDNHGLLAVAGAVATTTVLAVVGTAIAVLTRSAALAVGVVFGWILLVEPLVLGMLTVPEVVHQAFPGYSLGVIRNGLDDLDVAKAAVLMVGYTVALAAAVFVVHRRRDPVR